MFHLVSYDMKNTVMRVVFVVMLQSRVVLDKVYRFCMKKEKKIPILPLWRVVILWSSTSSGPLSEA